MQTISESNPTPREIKSRIASSYNQIADTYLKWSAPFSRSSLDLAKDYIVPHLSNLPAPRALELGCGAGIPTTKRLSEVPGIKITANDITPRQIELAKQNLDHGKVDFVEGDMMGLSFPDSSLDAVLAMYSIIHLPREEQVTMVQRISRWLSPGGLFLCSFPGEDFETSQEGDWLEEGAWMYWSS